MTSLDVSGLGALNQAIIRIGRLHRAHAGRLLRTEGLHLGQELVLMALWDAGPVRQSELSRAIESDPGAMTRSIARLEAAGLVRRSPDPTDGRAVLVEATEKSLELREPVLRAWAELERITAGALSKDRVEEIGLALDELEANLAQ